MRRRTGGNYRKTPKPKYSDSGLKVQKRLGHQQIQGRPEQKLQLNWRALKQIFVKSKKSSSTAAEEKQNEMACRDAANAFTFDSCLATDPTHGKFINGVVPASDHSPTPQRPSANKLHQQTIGVISKRPLISISDLSFLPETKSEIKRQRIA